MNMSFYNAAVGAQQQQKRINVQANNISNINTHGFKAGKPVFSTLMYRNLGGIDGAQLPRGTGTRVEMTGTDFASGPLVESAQPQSYAIDGNGFFALVDVGTGEVSYTRDGSFSLAEMTRTNEEGLPEQVFYLSDGMGRLVLSDTGTTIVVKDRGAEQPVGVFDFVNTDGMLHVGTNRFMPAEKNGQVRMGTGIARRGVIEASNVDLATELAKVIEAQRSFTYSLKMVQTSDEVESTINGLRG